MQPRFIEGEKGLPDQCLDHGLLERGGQIPFNVRGNRRGVSPLAPHFFHGLEEGGLEAAETEVQVASLGKSDGEGDGLWVSPRPRQVIDGQAAGVRQAQQLSRLVQGLARRVIHRLAERFVSSHVHHLIKAGMPS